MNLNQELQELNNKLEKFRRKLSAAEERSDTTVVLQFKKEIEALTKRIKSVSSQKNS